MEKFLYLIHPQSFMNLLFLLNSIENYNYFFWAGLKIT